MSKEDREHWQDKARLVKYRKALNILSGMVDEDGGGPRLPDSVMSFLEESELEGVGDVVDQWTSAVVNIVFMRKYPGFVLKMRPFKVVGESDYIFEEDSEQYDKELEEEKASFGEAGEAIYKLLLEKGLVEEFVWAVKEENAVREGYDGSNIVSFKPVE